MEDESNLIDTLHYLLYDDTNSDVVINAIQAYSQG